MNLCYRFLICIVLLYACSTHSESGLKEILINPKSITEFGNLDPYLSLVQAIQLETKPESLIGKIDKIVQYQGHYYILDTDYRNNILHFDQYGKFVDLMISDAEKEIYNMIRVVDFDIKDGKLYTIDNLLSALFVKELKSEKIDRLLLPVACNNLSVFDSGKIFIYSGFIGLNSIYERLNLFEFEKVNLKRIHGYFPFDERLENGNLTSKANLRLLKHNQNWLFHEYANDTIYAVGLKESEPLYLLHFPYNNKSNYLYDLDFQTKSDDYIRNNNLSLKSFGMFVLGDLLSIEYVGNHGDRQLVYDMKADTIIANCNYLRLKSEKLPVGFYWYPVQRNPNQVIAFLESEHILEMPNESIEVLKNKWGIITKENDNPLLTILETKK